MIDDLKVIKKKYGEEMMHFCRENFPTILEQPGILSSLLLNHFHPSRFLYQDITEQYEENSFKNYIYKLFIGDQESTHEISPDIKTPEELLSEAGYYLYECKSIEDILAFKKYYYPKEEICTFKGNRLNDCYVFFAIKKDVDSIKREDFLNPKRQDAYGTSVLSIQFSRDDTHLLSIKNRYNHTVLNCDATFSNNLDNIIEGLTDSFAFHYGMKQKYKNEFEIEGYVLANDGKYYKFNYEINNVYYCPDNIVIFNRWPSQYEKEKYLIMDYFVLDLEKKKIDTYDDRDLYDSFPKSINAISKIRIINEGDAKKILITPKEGRNILIILDDKNRIIAYYNYNITFTNANFLIYNKTLKTLILPNVKTLGAYFLGIYLEDEIREIRKLEELDIHNVSPETRIFIEKALGVYKNKSRARIRLK